MILPAFYCIATKRNGKSKAKQSEYEGKSPTLPSCPNKKSSYTLFSRHIEKIRVGRDYQAVCPQLVPELDRRPELMNERALLVWSPTKEIPDMKCECIELTVTYRSFLYMTLNSFSFAVEEYISVAKEKYGYNGEQALGMLFWHKHDLERAVMDLANFTPFPDEWTIEDKVLFEQAFQFHGKSFHRIRQMVSPRLWGELHIYRQLTVL